MTALRSHGSDVTEAVPMQSSSATEDYVGLAKYLEQAIARGDVNFDSASEELRAAVTPTERASLRRAAEIARRERGNTLAARLLGARD